MSDAREQMEKWAAKLPLTDYIRFQELFGPALTEARRELAHELAEKIRRSDVGDCCDECRAAAELSAREIDPEVSDG